MMYRIPWIAVLTLAIIMLPLRAADDKKAEKKDDDAKSGSLKDEKPDTKPPSNAKWTLVGELDGKLKKVSSDSLTVTVQYQEMQPNKNNNKNNANANRQAQNLQKQLAGLNRIKNPVQRMARMQQIMAGTQNAQMKAAMGNFKVVNKTKDVDVLLAQDPKVRVGTPPVEFDDKGNAKKYTSEELKKLKGPGNYWGYPADSNELKQNQLVRVFVYRKAKPTKKAAPTTSLKDKDKEKAKDDEDKDSDKDKKTTKPADEDDDDGTDPIARVIYILQDSNTPAGKTPGKNTTKSNN